MVGAKEQIQTIVNTLKKWHGLIKHFQRGNDNVEFPFLLQPSSSSDPLTNNNDQHHEINCIMHLTHLPTYVLLFDQVDFGESRIHAFLCRRIDERNLCIMLDLYYVSFDEKLSAKDRYEWSLFTGNNPWAGSGDAFPVCLQRRENFFNFLLDFHSLVPTLSLILFMAEILSKF